ncbi:peptidylprolyl isomerase [Candidatus Woesearchaeota archaeon]|nr:peptidylprolyl isomerase [Candidatus Woesearchaeota archaeon]
MAETLKKGDFVELDYTGVLKDGNLVFDTTIADLAKKEDIFNPKMAYGPVRICIGQAQILPGLDAHLEGLEVGKESELTLPPEDAFGKKDGKLMKLVPTGVFKKQGINPVTGLQVNIDGSVGTIRTVTGGRTIVDFNHPFAGKEVIYRVSIRRLITDDREKVKALCELALNQKPEALDVDIKDGKATVRLKQEFPQQLLNLIKERITQVLESITDVDFTMPEKKEAPKKEPKKEEPAKDNPEA